MKKINVFTVLVMMVAFFFSVATVNAQVTKEEKKTAKAQEKVIKNTEKNLFSASPKLVQKEAKKLEKEGWKSMSLPIAKQVETTWMKQYELDGVTGYNRYISATEEATANSFSAAQMQCDNLCKVRIAGQIQTTVMSEAKMELANHPLSASEAASITKSMEKSTNMVAQKLGRLTKTLEIYKILNNSNYMVRTTMVYDMNKIMDMVKADAIRDLQKELDDWKPAYEQMIETTLDNAKQKITNE
jgi:hypothetical protein